MRRRACPRWTLLGCWLAICAAPAAAADVELTVEFRDGSVVRAAFPDEPLPWRHVTPDGRVIPQSFPLGAIESLEIEETPATQQLERVRRLVDGLAADDYAVRLAAQRELVQLGGGFRPMLETLRKSVRDEELRWRLEEVLPQLPPAQAQQQRYDRLRVLGGGGEVLGDAGALEFAIRFQGAVVKLDRTRIRALRRAPAPDVSQVGDLLSAGAVRLEDDRDDLYPAPATALRRIDFSQDPTGWPLEAGRDVGRTFAPWGCTLGTSVADSYVAVVPYNVGARSGSPAAATHNPVYTGTITIRFCRPGNAGAAAGVRAVGVWVSHVAPRGTVLEAYDVWGRRLAAVPTRRSRRDFLGVTSEIPISFVRLVPQPEIDEDFAFDDLTFDEPRPFLEASTPSHFTAVLAGGDCVYCTGVAGAGDEVRLRGLTLGLHELVLPRARLRSLSPPQPPLVAELPQEEFLVRLADGTVVRAALRDGQVHPARFAAGPLDLAQVQAVWSGRSPLALPPEDSGPAEGAVAVLTDGRAQPLDEWSFRAAGLWLPALRDSPLSPAEFPSVWLAAPRPSSAAGRLRLLTGEELPLSASEQEGFRVVELTADGVALARGSEAWRVSYGEVRALVLPPAP